MGKKLLVVSAAAALGLTACGGSSEAATTVVVDATTTLPAPRGGTSGPGTTAAPTTQTTAAEATTSAPVTSVVTVTVGAPTASGPATATDPTSSAPAACATTTAREARDANLHLVPRSEPGYAWDKRTEEGLEGYDPCAALSWVVVRIERGTASSPYAVMLFHDGKYLGRASSASYGFQPQVVRVDDATLRITYTYAKDGEGTAQASGRAVGTFRWDDGQQKVVHSGEWPPTP